MDLDHISSKHNSSNVESKIMPLIDLERLRETSAKPSRGFIFVVRFSHRFFNLRRRDGSECFVKQAV